MSEIEICLNCTAKNCTGNCRKVSGMGGYRMRIRCVETGELFRNAVEAAKKIHRHPAAVRANLNGISSHCGGLHFVYVV